MVATKRCCRCGHKPITDFGKKLSSPDGLQEYCRACRTGIQREYKARIRARHTPEVVDIDLSDLEPAGRPPQAGLPGPEPIPAPGPVLSPLESAFAADEGARARRDLKKEHTALIDEVRKLRRELEVVTAARRAPDVLVYSQPAWERSDAVACSVASDWHVEEPVDRASVHGLNAFNLEVATDRSRHFFQNFLRLADIMARDTKITTLYIAALGDFFSGWIHEELLANALLAPADAALFCKGLWFSGIDFLLKESSYVLEGDFIPGNHGRMTKTMHFGNPTGTSLETVMYHGIVDRYHANPRVRFNVAKQSMVYRRFYEKFNMRLIHGYETKYQGGIGGLTIPLRKALASWNNPIRADLTILGHYHQLFDGGDFLVNGSLIGYNLYAQQIKAAYEEARQAFLLIHARNGGQKGVTAPIWLDDAHKTTRDYVAEATP